MAPQAARREDGKSQQRSLQLTAPSIREASGTGRPSPMLQVDSLPTAGRHTRSFVEEQHSWIVTRAQAHIYET